jgi:hypothetical protein
LKEGKRKAVIEAEALDFGEQSSALTAFGFFNTAISSITGRTWQRGASLTIWKPKAVNCNGGGRGRHSSAEKNNVKAVLDLEAGIGVISQRSMRSLTLGWKRMSLMRGKTLAAT